MVGQRNLIETEKIIMDSLHGEKIEFNDLIKNNRKYFYCKDFGKMYSNITASGLLRTFTGIVISEDCVFAIYYIPTEKPKDYELFYKYDNLSVPKEVLIFIASEDGVNADYICPIFTPYINAETQNEIMDILKK
ncbi:MAG: hypothetical protein LUF82_00875 [Clostridia bacterium]|nr:hypothetical protein [Clostridia bacterium]